MPYVTTPDKVKLYYEEVGRGTPILFIHEFASDWRGWEPQLREFGKRYRCITYSARGYTPSDVPVDASAYSYEHVMRDAVAVLDHLKIDRAHLIGLSMGGYTALQVALNHPGRVRSMVLAGAGSGSERWYTENFRKHSRAIGDTFAQKGSAEIARTYGASPSRIPFQVKDPRGYAEFVARLAEHDATGSAHMSRGFQGGRRSDRGVQRRKRIAGAMVKGLWRSGEIERGPVEKRLVAHVDDLGGVQKKILPGWKDAGALRRMER